MAAAGAVVLNVYGVRACGEACEHAVGRGGVGSVAAVVKLVLVRLRCVAAAFNMHRRGAVAGSVAAQVHLRDAVELQRSGLRDDEHLAQLVAAAGAVVLNVYGVRACGEACEHAVGRGGVGSVAAVVKLVLVRLRCVAAAFNMHRRGAVAGSVAAQVHLRDAVELQRSGLRDNNILHFLITGVFIPYIYCVCASTEIAEGCIHGSRAW